MSFTSETLDEDLSEERLRTNGARPRQLERGFNGSPDDPLDGALAFRDPWSQTIGHRGGGGETVVAAPSRMPPEQCRVRPQIRMRSDLETIVVIVVGVTNFLHQPSPHRSPRRSVEAERRRRACGPPEGDIEYYQGALAGEDQSCDEIEQFATGRYIAGAYGSAR